MLRTNKFYSEITRNALLEGFMRVKCIMHRLFENNSLQRKDTKDIKFLDKNMKCLHPQFFLNFRTKLNY